MRSDRDINGRGLAMEVEGDHYWAARSGHDHDRNERDLVMCVVEHMSVRPVSRTLANTMTSS
jgi:hypothetical protein